MVGLTKAIGRIFGWQPRCLGACEFLEFTGEKRNMRAAAVQTEG